MPSAEVLINHQVFLYRDKAPFVPSGRSTMGALEYDSANDALKCHECGEWFQHLGSHVVAIHVMLANEYKRKHGLRSGTSLIGVNLRRKIRELAIKNGMHKTLPSRGKKTRIRPGGGLRYKTGIDHEKRNMRGSCKAQMSESILRLAKFVRRTPTIDEARAYGVNHASAMRLFGKKWADIMLELGLTPRSQGKKTKFEEPMAWPDSYFGVNPLEQRKA